MLIFYDVRLMLFYGITLHGTAVGQNASDISSIALSFFCVWFHLTYLWDKLWEEFSSDYDNDYHVNKMNAKLK